MAKQTQERGRAPNPIQMQKYLGGVDYPADKQTLVENAKSKGADQDVLEVLERLPERKFEKPTDVSRAIGDLKV